MHRNKTSGHVRVAFGDKMFGQQACALDLGPALVSVLGVDAECVRKRSVSRKNSEAIAVQHPLMS